ncbi:hypothetical protein GS398_07730 [Pedobacter sp. HMF7056]|uniref:Beta-hexosaminidase bacterial type N-terminal domain-containing protein n=1 Tax=Hufsiella ginkgonis TaxID=2695274 RepID=A0A7K1XXE6_9SPHI|nr:hypothetical protein [Hufsiella ginkgonis]
MGLVFLFPNIGRARQAGKGKVTIVRLNSHVRVKFGAEKLAGALRAKGYEVSLLTQGRAPLTGRTILVGVYGEKWLWHSADINHIWLNKPKKEGFSISSGKTTSVVAGADASGTLYGCMEIIERLNQAGTLPASLTLTDQPEMVLRGTCIGLQKPVYLPGRGVYEYPYTPATFPWFYDKALWIKYLDMMVENRYNSLYLWNGHPFASLVRLKDYPYAVEVDEATFKKNEEIFRFLTREADKRGIWVIQMFYNIIVSKPFAEKNNLKTQDRNRPIVPLIADYTRKSIAAFVEKYPNVGLMVALGEAMEGVGNDDIEWFTKTIIPGVKDGLKALGKTDEPPIVLRAHDTDAPAVMKAALPLYKNLYTEAKFNGEALTTYEPRGPWADLHRTLSRIGTVQIENVHILANLEPFRYGSADFIQRSVKAMHSVYEANGLHLYPQSSYWDWPYTADNVPGRILQVDRDWMWYKTWGRYAWNAQRDRVGEIAYWSDQLGARYGCEPAKGRLILDAYEEAGEISPKLLRRYGITDGNRQTLTLGMLMTQLISPNKFGLFPLLYNSEAPEGEMIIEYAEKQWKKQPHVGETPVRVAAEVEAHGKKAIKAINDALPFVTRDKTEFERLRNDMYCQAALADFYAEKVRAALQVLRFKYSDDIADLEKAFPLLQKSVAHFRELTGLTEKTYLYANSMQTSQRKIPMRGVDGTYKEWREMLPVYEKELGNLRRNIDSLKNAKGAVTQSAVVAFKNATVTLTGAAGEKITLSTGERVFGDTAAVITGMVPELRGLAAVRTNAAKQEADGTIVNFTCTAPVKLLVGYFNTRDQRYLKAPRLENDANANEFGQDEIRIANALVISGLTPVNVHVFSVSAGTHSISLGRGRCLVLGFIPGTQAVKTYDAALTNERDVDWLFN